MSTDQAVVSVVIGTHDRLEQLRRAISSVLAQTSRPVRIYVTDAGSTDGTVEYLQGLRDPRVVPVLEGRRLGQAAAYNRVFRQVSSPYVCWLSDDNEVVNHGLDTAVRILERHGQIGLVALKVRDVQGPFVEAPYIGGVSALGILNVNQGVLRTADLLRVGGFSEWFRLYGIDPDLTAKILLGGQDVVYTRQVAVHHYRNWPADANSPEHARMMAQQAAYQEKYQHKYGALLPSGVWYRFRKSAWTWLKARHPGFARINDSAPIGGSLPRDWHNIMLSRFISLAELWAAGHPDFHLSQRIPRHLRPRQLPADPMEAAP